MTDVLKPGKIEFVLDEDCHEWIAGELEEVKPEIVFIDRECVIIKRGTVMKRYMAPCRGS